MGNVCSSRRVLPFNSEQNAHLDLLIVCDDRDSIKQAMNGIKFLFKTTELNKIEHRSIFDPENDKIKIPCNKVLFLVAGLRSKCQVESWIQELPNIKEDKDKHLVMCLQEDEDPAAHLSSEWTTAIVHRHSDVMGWFPKVLRFIYGANTIHSRSSSAQMCVIDSCSVSQRSTEFKQQFKTSLQQLATITEEPLSHGCNTVVYTCDYLGAPIENTIKGKLRQAKLNGSHVYVFAFSSRDTSSNDIESVATRTYTRRETMEFILHLMQRLKLLETKKESVSVPSEPSPPFCDITNVNILDVVCNFTCKVFLYFLAAFSVLLVIPQCIVIFICVVWISVLSYGFFTYFIFHGRNWLAGWAVYGSFCFMCVGTLVFQFGIFQRDDFSGHDKGTYSYDSYIVWCLIAGVYMLLWCLVVHFILIYNDFKFGALELPKFFYEMAN